MRYWEVAINEISPCYHKEEGKVCRGSKSITGKDGQKTFDRSQKLGLAA